MVPSSVMVLPDRSPPETADPDAESFPSGANEKVDVVVPSCAVPLADTVCNISLDVPESTVVCTKDRSCVEPLAEVVEIVFGTWCSITWVG